jgi:rare lipoprotein A
LLAAGLLLSFMLLGTACSTATRWGQPTPEQASNSPKVTRSDGQPPKSARGNPAFYEVFGKRYHVMPTSGGYTERGVASWYGNKFHGKPTSSGTPYDMHAMTAAHKTLPLPTRVRVTNLSNGRSVVVLVNDRGPFVDNRIIDMSYAAAHKLDMVRNGTAMVEVTAYPYDRPVAPAPQAPVLAETKPDGFSLPSPIATAEAAAPRPDEARTVSLFLQVGAFGEAGNAERLKARLEGNGLQNVVIHADKGGEMAMYRVRLGPIGDVSEYDQLVKRVTALDVRNPILISDADAGFSSPLPGG